MELVDVFKGLGVLEIVVLLVATIVLALLNERFVELLMLLGVFESGGKKAGIWQTVFGAIAVAVMALAQYVGVENAVTLLLNELVSVFTILVLIIPIAAQSGLAKLFHEMWKKIGFTVAPSIYSPGA